MKNYHNPDSVTLIGYDNKIDFMPLEIYLRNWIQNDAKKTTIEKLIKAIFCGAYKLYKHIATGHLYGDPNCLVGANSDGNQQKSIDIESHNLFVELLLEAKAGKLLSEESENLIVNPQEENHAIAFDPIDGSRNVGTSALIGTLSSIFPNTNHHDPFLVKGREQVAAGYICYGHSVGFSITVGDRLILGAMGPQTDIFYILRNHATLKADTTDLAYNAVNYHHLYPPMQQYIDEALQEENGPRGKNFNMQWLGAVVGKMHRIFHLGDLFFYVNDKRKGYEKGRLRLLYEAFPIAFLCEAALGKATDGIQNILDLVPKTYHESTPLIFGTAQEVDIIQTYHTAT